MMTFPEYDALDAIGIAQLIREGQVSPGEVLQAAIERIERLNPSLNAVVERTFERARTRLPSLADGPLYGVPFLLKDLKLQLSGTVTTNSTKLSSGKVATESSVLAQRYEAAGLQILGKTNTPEFG
ncbi:MAG: amidase family protein, partial [Myxococcota bacterium]|nr:amidase family protein [Myxococcota bacterium]